MLKPGDGATVVKTDSTGHASGDCPRSTTLALTNLLDYAIVEGAHLRRPLFVFLLRLARLALLEEEGANFGTIDFALGHDDN
jgi:hypothetical protein